MFLAPGGECCGLAGKTGGAEGEAGSPAGEQCAPEGMFWTPAGKFSAPEGILSAPAGVSIAPESIPNAPGLIASTVISTGMCLHPRAALVHRGEGACCPPFRDCICAQIDRSMWVFTP